MVVPCFLKGSSDELLLTQWRLMYTRGAAVVPALTFIAAACNFVNAYNVRFQPQSTRFLVGGLLPVAILPFTFITLRPMHNELTSREQKADAARKGPLKSVGTRELVERWSSLNVVRSVMALMGALIGCDAMLHLTF